MVTLYKFISLVKTKLVEMFSYRKRIIMLSLGKVEAYLSCLSEIIWYLSKVLILHSKLFLQKKHNSQNFKSVLAQ